MVTPVLYVARATIMADRGEEWDDDAHDGAASERARAAYRTVGPAL